ncbi:hypothetical protein GCM10010466_49640 [Planomonospora alba]|uniref:Aminoglycoside phosphotransferase domain-containing protein n=1 Tax=Planomonospora alba TaxID=161354 RepID=A0ABP6NLY0_9ACTN
MERLLERIPAGFGGPAGGVGKLFHFQGSGTGGAGGGGATATAPDQNIPPDGAAGPAGPAPGRHVTGTTAERQDRRNRNLAGPSSRRNGPAATGLPLLRMTHTEIEITAELVRELLRDQHPDLADHPVRLGARGWDNQLWRLGDDLAVRLPWATRDADALLGKEHAWLPALAPRLPLPVPVPQRLGEPSALFPRPWIVTTWVPGEPTDRAPSRARRRPPTPWPPS